MNLLAFRVWRYPYCRFYVLCVVWYIGQHGRLHIWPTVRTRSVEFEIVYYITRAESWDSCTARHNARGEAEAIMARSSGLSNFCPCSVYYFSCYPVESTKTIAFVHWNILMPAPTFATRAERVLLVEGAGIKYIYKLRFRFLLPCFHLW